VPAALGLKIDSGLQHLGVMFPLRFAGTDHDGPGWHEFPESACITAVSFLLCFAYLRELFPIRGLGLNGEIAWNGMD